MAYNFLTCDREQTYLMPPSLTDWLPQDHLAWCVLDAVEEMDLRGFYRRYREDGWGAAAFDPKMMVALLLYGYCVGERSSRRIERRCTEDVAFRVIAANQVPDHTTIARFRQANERALAACFTEVLKLCRAAGLLRVGLVALDGTKVEADASLAANRTLPQIEEEVARILQEAARADAEEDERFGTERRGDEMPEELRDRRSRLARLRECKARLEREEADRHRVYQEHLARRASIEAERGRPLRGRKPRLKEARSPATKKANPTDPESRVMKDAKRFLQGYNAQALVTEDHIIVAAAVTEEGNDRKQLRPMLQQTEKNLAEAGEASVVGTVVADAGYWNERELAQLDGSRAPELLVATQESRGRRSAPGPSRPTPRRRRMERKLATKRGRRLFAKRKHLAEPIFGEVKGPRRAGRFMRRGLGACDSEWKLICATNNLLKLWRAKAAAKPRPGP